MQQSKEDAQYQGRNGELKLSNRVVWFHQMYLVFHFQAWARIVPY